MTNAIYGAFLVLCMTIGGPLAAGAISMYIGERFAILGVLVPFIALILYFIGPSPRK